MSGIQWNWLRRCSHYMLFIIYYITIAVPAIGAIVVGASVVGAIVVIGTVVGSVVGKGMRKPAFLNGSSARCVI